MNKPTAIKAPRTAITPTRAEDYPQWYQNVIKAAELAETSPSRGCMTIRPWGYAIWEQIQQTLDQAFKATGHDNAYFPLLIPLSFIEKEAEHVEGFAKECAVVTHHRLSATKEGGLRPDGELEEPYVIRPTSETIIGHHFAKWISSYRDLPLKINQWANVMRWEMRTRLFLRSSEFLWQEGHTAHATAEEAQQHTLTMLNVYADFAEQTMAMPVILGEKTANERFPGAVNTYSIEAMMQDNKALQAGTSHYLGQNFSRSFGIEFTNTEGHRNHVYTTSWGVSTRLIGGLIMTHSDDNGLVLPPKLSPKHVVIIPIYRNDAERASILQAAENLCQALAALTFHGQPVRTLVDTREANSGEKNWHHIKKGVPVRVELGPRDIQQDQVTFYRRDEAPKERHSLPQQAFVMELTTVLEDIQNQLHQRAQKKLHDNTHTISTRQDFDDFFGPDAPGGFAKAHVSLNEKTLAHLKEQQVTARCIPLGAPVDPKPCLLTNEPVEKAIVFARAY